MNASYQFNPKLKVFLLALTVIGAAGLVYGFITQPDKAWASFLMHNFYFLAIAMGALMFYALQYVTHSGWSAMFQRIPLALGAFIPIAAVLMLVMVFGLHSVYEWSHAEAVANDPLLQHKSPFLNTPFFIARIVLYFSCWIGAGLMLKKYSDLSENSNDLKWFEKSEFFSKVFIFIFVITFSLASFDWIMSIDAHWYSTLFGLKTFLAAMYYGVAAVVLLSLYLHRAGYLPAFAKAHQHDFARYLFRFCIVWGYLWFVQFLVTWYANIPELTVYYNPRFVGEWQWFFYADLFMNFIIPFIALMSDSIGRRKIVLVFISLLLMAGFWVSLYTQIMPGSNGILEISIFEIVTFVGYLGAFLFVTFLALSKQKLIMHAHPYLQESLHHHL